MAQYYGVWAGRKPGVYDNWNDCKAQVDKFAGAKFSKLKSSTYKEALIEFKNADAANSQTTSKKNIETAINTTSSVANTQSPNMSATKPEENVLTVDGASNGVCCEFRAVWYPSKKEAFASKVLDGGTNNIAEFLGLVLAIKYLHENNLPLKVYTDSVTAMAWVRNKKANTTAHTTGKSTVELNNMLDKAEKYLQQNAVILSKVQVLKWETKMWGEIPADYGRK